MPRRTSPLILGEYWLDKRRDGKSPNRWQIAWLDRTSNSITYKSTKESDEGRAKKVLETLVRSKAVRQSVLEPRRQPDPMAVQVIPQFHRYMEEQGSYAVSAATIESHLRSFVAFLQQDRVGLNCTFDDMGKHLIERYRQWAMAPNEWSIDWKGKVVSSRSRGVCGATVRRSLASVKAALNLAKADRIVPYVWRLPPLDPKFKSPVRDRLLKPRELGAMIGYANGDDALRNWISIMLACAVRPIAATLLFPQKQWDAYSSRLDLQPTGKRRTNKRNPKVPIIPQLLPKLVAHEGYWIPPSVTHQTLSYRWRKMREALGLSSDVIPKAIRHTIVTYLWTKRANPHYISMLIGHAKLDSWDNFDYITPAYYEALVPPLSALWEEVHTEAAIWSDRYAVVQTERGNRLIVHRDNLPKYRERPRQVSPYDVVSPGEFDWR